MSFVMIIRYKNLVQRIYKKLEYSNIFDKIFNVSFSELTFFLLKIYFLTLF